MKLTVIVPAYNVADYIGATLDSILIQDPPFDEVIIVNDGSTDNTLQTIQDHPCGEVAQIIITDNEGLGPARNAGVAAARGDYLHFLDADDVLDAAFTRVIQDTIASDNAPDLILFAEQDFPDKPEMQVKLDVSGRGREMHGCSNEDALVMLVQTGNLHANAVLYVSKRRLWEKHRLQFKPIVHEDEEMLFPVMLAAKTVTVLRTVLYHRRIRENSITTSIKNEGHCKGLICAADTASRLYRTCETDDKRVRKIIRHKAIRLTKRYMRTCCKTGIAMDFGAIRRCATRLYSPGIVFGCMGALAKSMFVAR